MGKRLTLVLGGARSGKSDFAQTLAQRRGGDQVLFLATAEALDSEMQARIAAHRAARPGTWNTLEAPRNPAQALRAAPGVALVLLDCVTLWASNVLLADATAAAPALLREVDDLIAWYRASDAQMVLVSNEVGSGLVPSTELGRAYRDLLGWANRKIAAEADEVFYLVAGLPLDVKRLAVRLEDLV